MVAVVLGMCLAWSTHRKGGRLSFEYEYCRMDNQNYYCCSHCDCDRDSDFHCLVATVGMVVNQTDSLALFFLLFKNVEKFKACK